MPDIWASKSLVPNKYDDLDLVPDLDPEPKLFQSRNRNCSKSVRFHNTDEYCFVSLCNWPQLPFTAPSVQWWRRARRRWLRAGSWWSACPTLNAATPSSGRRSTWRHSPAIRVRTPLRNIFFIAGHRHKKYNISVIVVVLDSGLQSPNRLP